MSETDSPLLRAMDVIREETDSLQRQNEQLKKKVVETERIALGFIKRLSEIRQERDEAVRLLKEADSRLIEQGAELNEALHHIDSCEIVIEAWRKRHEHAVAAYDEGVHLLKEAGSA